MKLPASLPVLIFLAGGAFLLAGIAFLVVSGMLVEKEPEVVEEPQEPVATTTPPEPEEVPFTEEGRQPSVPANAAATAPVCDQGIRDRIADPDAMRRGEITDFTKESVIQAIIRRDELFRTAPASCIRTYFLTGFAIDGGDWDELAAMNDEKLIATARFMAAINDSSDARAFRERMLGPDAAWQFGRLGRGPDMRIGFTEGDENSSVTTYQTAYFHEGVWY